MENEFPGMLQRKEGNMEEIPAGEVCKIVFTVDFGDFLAQLLSIQL